jgi:hypothetical protein
MLRIALVVPTSSRKSASKLHSAGTMLTFRPPRITPTLKVTLRIRAFFSR